jgi:hypothetical protein
MFQTKPFAELTLEAMNIVLTAENTERITNHLYDVAEMVSRRIANEKPVTLEYLAGAYSLRSIVAESIKQIRHDGGAYHFTPAIRKESALYLADNILNEVYER